jgi:hypothetical protein
VSRCKKKEIRRSIKKKRIVDMNPPLFLSFFSILTCTFSKPSFERMNALVLIRLRSRAFLVSQIAPREEKNQSKIDKKQKLNKKQ